MTTKFDIHTIETAPEGARELLGEAKKKFGFVPNLYGVFAGSPSSLDAYRRLAEAFERTSLSPVEQQVVLLAISFENRCTYCMGAHSMIAKMVGVPGGVIAALRSGEAIPDDKLEALRKFAVAVVRERGEVADEVPAFLAAGYSQANVLDVLLGNAMKSLSNYTNHVAETPLDAGMAEFAWTPPAG